MKASELRIGNLVDDNGDIREVISINSFECELENKNIRDYLVRIDNIKSIPLTEEWLLKFGLLKNDLGIWNNGDAIYFNYGFEESIKIKYVHELQNLYFALTGSELELKDK